MSDRSRWDPEMRAYQAEAEAIAAKFPPVKLELPLEPHRAVNDAISLARGARGPEMAETTERWVAARGRRIYCRVHRPLTDRALPVLVYFHGGGWVWGSVDTHDSAARSLAAGGEVAVVSVDYALSPEAKFPQALEECAAVVRHVARDGAAWGLDPTRILLGGDFGGRQPRFGDGAAAARHRRAKARRDRHGLPGVRQQLRDAQLSGVRHRACPDAGENGVLLERLRAA